MRILILSNSDVGLYKFRKELIEELINPGCYIDGRKDEVCEVFVSIPNGEFVNKIKKLGCRFIDTPIDRRGVNPVRDFKLFMLYRNILKLVKPDIVFSYTIKPNIYGGIACAEKTIPYIANITGLGTAVESKGILQAITLTLYKFALCRVKTVFFQNERNKSFFEQNKIVKTGILIPGSGVNLDENKFEDYPIYDGTLRFLYVGRIMRSKGISELLDCAMYIKSKYPFVSFDIVGSFDEDAFRNKIETYQKKGFIKYYGQQDDVHTFIKTHHATILPTYHEGLSNVLLETAAAGRPVIATNIPGCKEAFEDGITGIGFEPKNTDSLIKAVEYFISLPYEKRKMMGIAAREKVTREFDRKRVIRAYIDILKKQ